MYCRNFLAGNVTFVMQNGKRQTDLVIGATVPYRMKCLHCYYSIISHSELIAMKLIAFNRCCFPEQSQNVLLTYCLKTRPQLV